VFGRGSGLIQKTREYPTKKEVGERVKTLKLQKITHAIPSKGGGLAGRGFADLKPASREREKVNQ